LPVFAQADTVARALGEKQVPVPSGNDAVSGAARDAEALKMAALYAMKVATERFGTEIDKHQEVMAAIADVVMDAYAVDSMVARTRQSPDPLKVAMTQAYAADALARSGERARRALCASSEGQALDTHLRRIAPLFAFRPFDPAALRETVVRAAEEAGGYPLAIA